MEDGKKHSYSFDGVRYFFVEKFYPADFKKETLRTPLGFRMFDLTEVLGAEKLPEVGKIAELLEEKEVCNVWWMFGVRKLLVCHGRICTEPQKIQ